MRHKSVLSVIFYAAFLVVVFWAIYYFVRIRPSKLIPRNINYRKDVVAARKIGLLGSKLKWDEIIGSSKNEKWEISSQLLEENLVQMKEELAAVDGSYNVFSEEGVFAEPDRRVKVLLDKEKRLLEQGISIIEGQSDASLEEIDEMVSGMEEVIAGLDEWQEKLDQSITLFE